MAVAATAGWRERLGLLPPTLRQEATGAIWIHAVSVGETLAVAGLVRALMQRYPERKIFLSSVTATGREAGEKKLPGVAGRFYLPFDWKWSVRRVLRQIRPSRGRIYQEVHWEPGQALQVDWGSCGQIQIGSTRRKISVLVAVLSETVPPVIVKDDGPAPQMPPPSKSRT